MSAEITATIAEVLSEWSLDRINNAKQLLVKQGIPETSPLNQSIFTTEVKVQGLNVGIGFNANNYYVFIDEGVKGLKNARPNSGLFSFKTPFPNREMIKNIGDYVAARGIIPSGGGKSVTIPKKDKAAIGIAFAVKQLGIAQKPFWKPTFNEAAFNDLAARLEDALGGDINLTLTIE
jgi:hypothetical protein